MSIKAILADIHLHNWQQFATVNPTTGVNTRLDILLGEILRSAKEVQLAGGNQLIIAGDLFHVRGSIAPTVLNPTLEDFEAIIDNGIEVIVIPGNHDLEGKDSSRVSSAVTALEKVGAKVITVPTLVGDSLMVPWIESIDELKKILTNLSNLHLAGRADIDLVIHAPIDNVIPGLPAHGLDDVWLAKLGFRRVFSGHYHNHKDFGNGVYSIGALAHHTWSDPGSRAGFLIVDDTDVRWMKSHAPEFVDIDADMDPLEVELKADRNFVRAKINKASTAEVEEARAWLIKSGALGVVINTVKEPTRARVAGATVKAGGSIESSIGDYIAASEFFDDDDRGAITAGAIAILGEID